MSGNTEFEEVRVEIERDGKPVVIAFQRRRLSRVAYVRDGRETVCRAYATPKDKIAVTKRSAVARQASIRLNEETWVGIASGNEWWQPIYALLIADTREELRTQLDAEIVAKLQGKAEPIPVEHLDLQPVYSTNMPRES